MSVATQIERLQGIKSQIKTKMIDLGLSTENETLQELADDLDTVVNRGDASAALSTSARSKTLSAGYYTGGTISMPPEYYPITNTNTTVTASDVLSGKKFVNTAGEIITGNIATASSSNVTGTVSVTNPSKIILKTNSATGSSTGSANASATISKQLYTGSSGVTNSSLGAKDITATAEVALASSVTGSSTIPSTLPTGTVQVSPSTTKTIYSDTSNTSGYIKSFVVDSIKTEEATVRPTTSRFDVTPSESGKFLTKVTVDAIPNQRTGNDVSASVSTDISNITSIDATQKTDGITIIANSEGDVTVPLGFYAQQVTKAPSSSASTTVKPALAGTNGTIELTAGTNTFRKTSVDDYANGFITAVIVNPTPSTSLSVTPTTSTQEFTTSSNNNRLFSSVKVNAIPSPYFDTSGVTATADTVLSDKKFVNSSGTTVTGTIATITPANNGTTNPGDGYTNVATIGRNTNNQFIKIDKGYNNTARKFTVSGVHNGAYSASVGFSGYSLANATSKITGTITNIATTTEPTSGVDGSDYYTITPNFESTSSGSATAYGTATIGTAGYIDKGNISSDTLKQTVGVYTTLGSDYYIKASTTSTTTISDPGNGYTNLRTVTPTKRTQYVPITAGYLGNSKIAVGTVPSFQVVLRTASWGSDSNTTIGKYYYNVSDARITDGSNLYVMPDNISTAQSFGVYAYSQSAGSMQFRAVAKPTSNLEYTIYYLS